VLSPDRASEVFGVAFGVGQAPKAQSLGPFDPRTNATFIPSEDFSFYPKGADDRPVCLGFNFLFYNSSTPRPRIQAITIGERAAIKRSRSDDLDQVASARTAATGWIRQDLRCHSVSTALPLDYRSEPVIECIHRAEFGRDVGLRLVFHLH
jgi:hypothetical protein